MKNKKTKKTKNPHELGFLGVALAALLLLAAFGLGSAPLEWKTAAFQTLNLSDPVSASWDGLARISSPVIEAASGINEFYKAAAAEVMELLDFSDTAEWPSRVAGAYTDRNCMN